MNAPQAPQHTPGPWHWDSDPVKGDEYSRVRYRVVALGRTITQTYYSSAVPGEPQTAEADTRLCAASPVLLKACQQALYALKGREHDQFLRDAIALATGGS